MLFCSSLEDIALRAFLSHSSADKGFVERVAELMRAGTYELDSTTFDAGLINSEAIRNALRRSDLFCLFLSRESVRSTYVEFETLLGVEFLARGAISQFLAICIDDDAFALAQENVKLFNIVRKSNTPESVARLIQGQLISASSRSRDFSHPFSGRKAELKSLEEQASDLSRPHTKALYISGNAGSGRRSLALKFFESHFPHVGRIFPPVVIAPYDGPAELYRRILSALRPTITSTELRGRLAAFNLASGDEQIRMSAQLLNSLLPSNETAFLLDEGGLLTDAGSFSPEINKLIDALDDHPHPPVVFISPRMLSGRYRTARKDVIFLALNSLPWDETRGLTSTLLKRRNIEITPEALDELTKLSEGHPFNIYRLIDEVAEKGIKTFLASQGEFLEWEQRQTSEYVSGISFDNEDTLVLALLKGIPELDFDTIVSALKIESTVLAQRLHRLVLLHVLESSEDRFRIAPALRVAVERDARVKMPGQLQATATSSVAKSLALRIEDGTAPVSLVDAAVLASIESGETLTSMATAFLLPSHYVWLAKLRYDQHQWLDSIRFGLEAIKGAARLSSNGLVAACRFLCLASARVGDDEVFQKSIKTLRSRANDDWARSNVAYLEGFQQRMRGRLPDAQTLFQKAYDYHNGNISAMRELAAISLARGDLDKAEGLAREAHSFARTNPYLVDMLLTILIRKPNARNGNSEIDDLFAILEKVGEEDGRSFFTTRRAEFEHLWGDNKKAAQLIDQAASKTPTIFDVRRLQAEIYLKAGNKNRADDAIQAMTRMMNDRDVFDRRRNYRAFLETRAHYLVEVGHYDEAKELFRDGAYFTPYERDSAIKDIEVTQAFKSSRRQ